MRSITTIVGLVFCSAMMFAQQQPPSQPPNSPIELPEFLVTGKELINVGAGAKSAPQRPPLLSATRLDSLNPTEKQPIPALPARPLPQYRRTSVVWPGYLQAEIGNYITPNVLAGYSFVAGGYRLDFSGDVQASDGWADNTQYLTTGLKVVSTYVAPDKFIFFGGSTTQADLGLRHRSYRLFARPDALERTHTSMDLGVGVDGKYEDVRYQAKASWTSQSLSTSSMRDVSDNVFRGSLRAEQQWKSADVGLMMDMRLQTYAENAYPFVEAGAYGRWVAKTLRIAGGAGVQWATSSTGVDRFGLGVGGQADLFLGPDLTVTASVRSGMRSVTFRDLVMMNPYIDDSVRLDAAYDIVDLRGTITFHPSVRTTISAGVRMRQTDREPVWVPGQNGTFSVDYRTVSLFEINADARFIITPRDIVVADVRMTNASVSEASAQPYLPSIRASADYQRTWFEALRTGVGVVYIGQRWADLANTIALSGYADLRLNASYTISSSFDLHARAENLLGSTVILWEGYRERGIFVTVGCTWKF
ncbi:MAG: TonB-dependent receptor [Ignavibacteria bacterium]|nr:TonB-dependent receptor [Ignavibacteria bacterium]